MEYNVQLQQVDSQPLLVVRRQASSQQLAQVVPDACGIVWKVIQSLKIPGAGRHIAVYFDDQINLEVGVELDNPLSGISLVGEVMESTTPAGTVATTVHFGSYHQLYNAHKAVHDWCASNHYTFAGPSWEIYGHWTDECNRDATKIRTDIFYLVSPIEGSSS